MYTIKKGQNLFYVGEDVNNPLAVITFVPDGNSIIVDHTYVNESLRGQGIGIALIQKIAVYARLENKKIIPQCPFVHKVMTRNDEYKDLLL